MTFHNNYLRLARTLTKEKNHLPLIQDICNNMEVGVVLPFVQ